MTGIEIIGLISGIASIFGIPLAFHFDRKNQISKYEIARKKIIDTLLHQIGTGQAIDIVGIKLIIDSKLRQASLKPGKIGLNEILADLYTNVTTNPLIDTTRRSDLQTEIKQLRIKHNINNLMLFAKTNKKLPSGEPISEDEILKIENFELKQKGDYLQSHRHTTDQEFSFIGKSKDNLKLFNLLATLLSVVASLGLSFIYKEQVSIRETTYKTFIIGILVSLGVGFIITIVAYLPSKKKKNRNPNIEDADYEMIEDNKS